jgi:PAS domain S-box-containing protein
MRPVREMKMGEREPLFSNPFEPLSERRLKDQSANGSTLWAELESGLVSFRGVFRSLPDAALLLDQRGRLLDLNAAAEKALARTRSQLLGCTLTEIGASSALVRRFDDLLLRTLADGASREATVTLETPRGTFHWEIRFHRAGGGDEVPYVLGVFRDVTASVQQHGQLESRNHELAQIVDALCHDLRSPIATIRSFVGFLLADLKAHDQSQIATDLAMIQNAVDKMAELITAISRRTRRTEPRTDPVESRLSDIVNDAVTLLAGCLAARHAVVEVAVDSWTIRGDRGSFVEIFENLIENAVTFTSYEERPRVSIGVEEWRGSPTIYVRDEGMGIDPSELSRVFDRRERLDDTGMGLSLVKALLERHGGTLWIESAGPGRGTTVRLKLAGLRRSP